MAGVGEASYHLVSVHSHHVKMYSSVGILRTARLDFGWI